MCKKLICLMSVFVALGLSLPAAAQLDPSLVGWWTFDEGEGEVAADSSGNGYDGTVIGATWTAGFQGAALDMAGVGYVDVPPEAWSTIENQATVAFWAYGDPAAQPQANFIFGAFQEPADNYSRVMSAHVPWSNGTIYFDTGGVVGGDDSSYNRISKTGDAADYEGTWTHWAFVKNAETGDQQIYINGVLWHSGTGMTNPMTGVTKFTIGTKPSLAEGWYYGKMDDFRLYDRALNKDEILSLASRPKAYDPLPADGAISVTSPLLQWTPATFALFHDVYLGTSEELTEADLVASRQMFAMYWHIPGLQPGVTYYWRIDEINQDGTVETGELWDFTAMPLTAYAPAPADAGDGASQAPILSWLPGQGAMGHHLYFGDSFDAVKDGTVETDKGAVTETTFGAGLLRAGTTYYWRVDETDSAGGIQIGEVWSFTTGQPADGKIIREWWLNNSGVAVAGLTGDPRYPGSPDGSEFVDLFEGPVDWADNYGTRLYGWLVPPESGDYTFWIASDDGSELWLSTDEDPANGVMIASVPGWTPARDFDNTGGGVGDADAQKSDLIALAAGAKYYIEALMNEGGGGDNIAVAWQVPGGTREVIPGEFVSTYALAPLSAAAPSPENGATDTIQSPILSWFAGENAVAHHVYFGDDADAVAGADTTSAEYKGRQAGATYNPGALEWGKRYAWRVDEEEADGTVRTGAVWGFTTAAFLLIEDFERYDDDMDAGTAIFQTWIDGWENGTGSTVGYLTSINGTFGETSTVYTGRQSMPLDYNNVNSPYYSETSRTFAPAVNMTVGGMDTLTLFVRGQTGNDPAPLYIGLQSGATRVNLPYGDDTVVQTRSWVEVSVPLADFAGVNAAAVNEMFISLGNPDAPASGGAGLVFIDAIRATKAAPATE